MSDYGQIEQQLQIQSQSHDPKQQLKPVKYHNNYHEIQSQNFEPSHNSSQLQPQKIQPLPKINNNQSLFKLVMPQEERNRVMQRGNTSDQKQKRIKVIPRVDNVEDIVEEVQVKSTNLLIYDLDQEDGEKLAEVIEIKKVEDQGSTSSHLKQNQFINFNYECKEEKHQKRQNVQVSNRWQKQVQDENTQEKLFQVRYGARQQVVQPKVFQEILQNHSSTDLLQRPTTAHLQNKEKAFNSFLKTKAILDNKTAQIKKGILLEHTEQIDEDFKIKQREYSPTIDSGLQITSINSIEQSSSRNILSFPSFSTINSKSRSKLQSLQPYKDSSIRPKLDLFQKQKEQKKKLEEIPQKHYVSLFGSLLIRSQDIENVAQFVTKAVPYAKKLECILKRNKNTCKRVFLDYDLYTKEGGKFLLSCKKIGFKIYSTYHISLATGQYDQKSDYFMAKVQGNFSGSVFNFFSGKYNEDGQKQLLGTIVYSDAWSCCKQSFRSLEIYLLNLDYRYRQLQGYNSLQTKNLKDLYEYPGNKKKRIRKLISKQPTYSQARKTYSMNFHGKAKMPSIKNMIMVNDKRLTQQTLLFAKRYDDQFEMDICYPFSPMVALGLVISGFDFKLASQ